MTFGQCLREARERLNKHQGDIAEVLDWPQSKVSDVERDRQVPKLTEIAVVSAAYGVPVTDLLALPMGEAALELRRKALRRKAAKA